MKIEEIRRAWVTPFQTTGTIVKRDQGTYGSRDRRLNRSYKGGIHDGDGAIRRPWTQTTYVSSAKTPSFPVADPGPKTGEALNDKRVPGGVFFQWRSGGPLSNWGAAALPCCPCSLETLCTYDLIPSSASACSGFQMSMPHNTTDRDDSKPGEKILHNLEACGSSKKVKSFLSLGRGAASRASSNKGAPAFLEGYQPHWRLLDCGNTTTTPKQRRQQHHHGGCRDPGMAPWAGHRWTRVQFVDYLK
ncbi:hypothetical protein IWZ00DRAFT_309571 [Phyllosticta capitalensis]